MGSAFVPTWVPAGGQTTAFVPGPPFSFPPGLAPVVGEVVIPLRLLEVVQ